MTIWKRNLLFGGLCLLGMSALAGSLLPKAAQSEVGEYEEFSDVEFLSTVSEIDRQFQQVWSERELIPALPADNLTIIRRISLGLTGTIPSLEEIRKVEQIEADQQIMWWTNRLLHDRRFADYLAERLARAYVGTEDGPFLIYRRRRFTSWLSDQIYENRPYNELATELISGTGLWTDSPAVNFVTVTTDVNGDEQPDEARLAVRTSRAFLGVRLDCVQCHDDHLGGNWMQSDFHQLASYFSEAKNSLLGIADKQGKTYEFKYLDADETEKVPPSVPFLQQLEVDTKAASEQQSNLRKQLANWVTHPENQAFSRAITNRIWAILFGRPMVNPIDDIPLSGPYPSGMETLARDFSKNEFDLRRLIRLIVSTQAFQISSRHSKASESHEDAWAVFPVTRLRPEQVAGALLQACSLKTHNADSHVFLQFVRYNQAGDFVKRYGDSGEDEFGANGGTIPQRLLLMNGQLVQERTEDNLVLNASTRIASLAKDNLTAINTAYLSVLNRLPSDAELKHFEPLLQGDESERSKAFTDLFWVLLNSSEFSWNH